MSLFAGYLPNGFYDEMFEAPERPRAQYERLYNGLAVLRPSTFAAKTALADRCYLNQGITFAVKGREETFPFDLLPRLIPADEWAALEAGLVQRVRALDRFLGDVYGPRRAVRDGVVPHGLIATCQGYQREMIGVQPPGGAGCTWPGSTWCATPTGAGWCSRTTCARPRACPTSSQNRRLHAPRVPRGLRVAPRRAGGPRPVPAARRPGGLGAGRPRRAAGGAADPRAVQRRLLRARLPGPADGHPAGRGPRPGGARPAGVAAHHAAAASRWT